MVLHIEQPVQRLDAGKALAQRFRLAIADNDELAAPGTMRCCDWRGAASDAVSASGSSSLIRSTEFDLQRRHAQMVQPDVERRVRPGFERQIERHGKIERDRSAPELVGADIAPRQFHPVRLGPAGQQHRPASAAPAACAEYFDPEHRPVLPPRRPAPRLHNQPESPARQPQIRPSAVKQASRRLVSRYGHAAAAACAGRASSCSADRASASGCSLPGPAPPPAAFRDRPN